jgi:hypothetical protein
VFDVGHVSLCTKSLNENISILKAKSVPNFSVFLKTAELKMEEDMKINKKQELND